MTRERQCMLADQNPSGGKSFSNKNNWWFYSDNKRDNGHNGDNDNSHLIFLIKKY